MIMIWLFSICFVMLFQEHHACNFPPQLIGTWRGADRGTMTFQNSTYFTDYDVTIPNVPFFDFVCQEQRGSQYYLKAVQENNIFGLIIKFYMCLEIHAVDDDIGYYYKLTEYDLILQDSIIGDGIDVASFDTVCTRPVVPRNYIPIIRDGSIADGSLNVTCPEALQAQFGNVSIQHKTETEPSMCPGTVFDVCSDKTLINVTYNSTCSTDATDKTLSAQGIYRCIHAIRDGSDTYLSVWNDDPGVTNPFYCFAYQRIGGVVYATETPNYCGNTTVSTEAETGGVKMVIWDIISTCEIILPTTTEAPPNLAGLWALLILPFIFLLILILLIARYCCKKYGCICKKIKLPKRKKKPPPLRDDSTGTADIVGKAVFVPSVIKQPKLYNFRPKKPLDNFFPLFDPDWSPSPYLQPVAKVEPLYKDTIDDYMRGRLPRRPSGASLYSFSSGRLAIGPIEKP